MNYNTCSVARQPLSLLSKTGKDMLVSFIKWNKDTKYFTLFGMIYDPNNIHNEFGYYSSTNETPKLKPTVLSGRINQLEGFQCKELSLEIVNNQIGRCCNYEYYFLVPIKDLDMVLENIDWKFTNKLTNSDEFVLVCGTIINTEILKYFFTKEVNKIERLNKWIENNIDTFIESLDFEIQPENMNHFLSDWRTKFSNLNKRQMAVIKHNTKVRNYFFDSIQKLIESKYVSFADCYAHIYEQLRELFYLYEKEFNNFLGSGLTLPTRMYDSMEKFIDRYEFYAHGHIKLNCDVIEPFSPDWDNFNDFAH